jgi:RNA polymerase sigma factor (sigma-70 family)
LPPRAPSHDDAERPSDADLVARCLDGDERAWESLVRRYRRLVYSVPMRMGLKGEDADDVFQETFATLLTRLGTVRDAARLGLWLAVTARRKGLDRVTRSQAAREVELPETLEVASTASLPVDELMRLERQHAVRRALQQLPERCRRLLEALYQEDAQPAYRDVASTLGVPVGSLGPTRARCLDRLRRALAALDAA